MTEQVLVTFPCPEHIRAWSVSTKYDGTYHAWVSRHYDLRDNYDRILGDIHCLAVGATPYEAMSIALNKLEKLTQQRLAECNSNPPKEHPVFKSEVDDLMNMLGL